MNIAIYGSTMSKAHEKLQQILDNLQHNDIERIIENYCNALCLK